MTRRRQVAALCLVLPLCLVEAQADEPSSHNTASRPAISKQGMVATTVVTGQASPGKDVAILRVAGSNLPALGLTVAAGRGLGCFANGQRTRVRQQPDQGVAGSMIMTSGIETWSATQIEALHRAGGRLRTWGDGYGYALVAWGRVDAMVDPIAALWDLAPMPVILEEAGGHFSNLNGDNDPAGGNGIGACTRRLCQELSEILLI